MDGDHQSLKCCAVKLAILVTDILDTFLDQITNESKRQLASNNLGSNQSLAINLSRQRIRAGQDSTMQEWDQTSWRSSAGGACQRPQQGQQQPSPPVQEIVFTFNPDGTMTQRVAPVTGGSSTPTSNRAGRASTSNISPQYLTQKQGANVASCANPRRASQPSYNQPVDPRAYALANAQRGNTGSSCPIPRAANRPPQANSGCCMTRNAPSPNDQSMTLQELDNLCSLRQREIEASALSQGFSFDAPDAHSTARSNPRESLSKTLDLVVTGLERIVQTWEKSIETGKQEDPTDPEQLSRVLAERLLNKSQDLEKQQKEVEEILKGLKNIVPEEMNPNKLNDLLSSLQGMRAPPSKCPHCCSCGASLKKDPPQNDPPPT